MSGVNRQILEELKNIRAELSAMRSTYNLARITYYEALPMDSVVDVDFIAYVFNISEEAARRGRFGTDAIPRFRDKPLQFLKRDVLAVFREQTKPSSERAAEIRFRAKNKINRRK